MCPRSCSKETNLRSQRIKKKCVEPREREREREQGHAARSIESQDKRLIFLSSREFSVETSGSISISRRWGAKVAAAFYLFRFCVPFCSEFASTIDRAATCDAKKTFLSPFFFPHPFPFHFYSFFFPRGKNGKKTERVVNTGVVVQEAFNQRAWKILFTRSRIPHRMPLYVSIRFFTPAHAAPLHTGPTFHDWLLDFERRALFFFSLFCLPRAFSEILRFWSIRMGLWISFVRVKARLLLKALGR